jgi:hypothetical protein
MNTVTRPLAWLALIGLAPLAALAQDFSADSVVKDPAGGILRGKVYRASNLYRVEAVAPTADAANPMTVIVDVAGEVSYVIDDRQKIIMVSHGRAALNRISIAVPANGDLCARLDKSSSQNVSCRSLGEDTLNGRPAVKWAMTATYNGQTATQYVWVDPKLGAAVRIDAGRATHELQNIQEAPQPARLFAIPADYRRIDLGGR